MAVWASPGRRSGRLRCEVVPIILSRRAVPADVSVGTRLLAVSISEVFAVLLIAGVIAIGLAALISLILLLLRGVAHSRS